MFFHHSSSPVGIGQSAMVGLRNSREWCSMVECRHPETMFGSRGHGMLIGDWGNRHGALGLRLVGWCSRNRSHAARCWSGRWRRVRPSGVHLHDDAGGWCWRRGRGRQGWKPWWWSTRRCWGRPGRTERWRDVQATWSGRRRSHGRAWRGDERRWRCRAWRRGGRQGPWAA